MYFCKSNESDITSVPKGAKILFLGIGGIGMAQLACLLAEKGFNVEGVDNEIWEPSKSWILSRGLKVKKWEEINSIEEFDFVVIGNAVLRSNKLLPLIEASSIPFCSMAKVISDFLLRGRTKIVIAGTHGKSTTTALIAFGLTNSGFNPSVFVGAAGKRGEILSRVGTNFAVVEGDEYDSAFFSKISKFYYYDPDYLVITSLDFDHKDIFPSRDAYIENFVKFINSQNQVKKIILSSAAFKNLSGKINKDLLVYPSQQFFYEEKGDSVIFHLNGEIVEQNCSLIGKHNKLNMLGALICLKSLDVDLPSFSDFQGLKRRLELIYSSDEVIVIDDFAHHPEEVRAGIFALRDSHPKRKIIVVFEPRSNTSRSSTFQHDYEDVFKLPDAIVIKEPIVRHNDDPSNMLDVKKILCSSGKEGFTYKSKTGEVLQELKNLALRHRPSLVVFMSNGSFEGMIGDFVGLLKS